MLAVAKVAFEQKITHANLKIASRNQSNIGTQWIVVQQRVLAHHLERSAVCIDATRHKHAIFGHVLEEGEGAEALLGMYLFRLYCASSKGSLGGHLVLYSWIFGSRYFSIWSQSVSVLMLWRKWGSSGLLPMRQYLFMNSIASLFSVKRGTWFGKYCTASRQYRGSSSWQKMPLSVGAGMLLGPDMFVHSGRSKTDQRV